MKLSKIFCILLVVISVCTQTFSMPSTQEAGVEKRPFDFRDKFYEENGIEPVFIVDRKNGNDKYSVIDFINDGIHRGVRITGTWPAYSVDGKPLYLNIYGELFKNAFSTTKKGEQALEIANRYPIYVFPSALQKGKDRQAFLADTRDGYFDKNPLGLGVLVLVEFTDRIYTKEGEKHLKRLASQNGTSLDGTPLIRTLREIEDLTRRNLVTQRIRGLDDETKAPYAVAKVIQDPAGGAIARDAFLMMVTRENGKYLEGEQIFADQFKCLQTLGEWCD